MTPREQATIDLALKVLDEVSVQKKPPESLTSVRPALRVLLPHCPENLPLTGFWDGVQNVHEIGRSQTMQASLNGIMLQMEKRGGSGWRSGARRP
jgi:hypothetical protein